MMEKTAAEKAALQQDLEDMKEKLATLLREEADMEETLIRSISENAAPVAQEERRESAVVEETTHTNHDVARPEEPSCTGVQEADPTSSINNRPPTESEQRNPF